MRELALHILDIAQNSIAAAASLVTISIDEQPGRDLLRIEVADNGRGIPPEELAQITDPFFTSRTTRDVGLGLPLFAQAAERAEGKFEVKSMPGRGTEVTATLRYSHIDRAPLGDLTGTLLGIIVPNPELDLIYTHYYKQKSFLLGTGEIKSTLGRIAISHPEVVSWLRDFIQAGLDDLYGGE